MPDITMVAARVARETVRAALATYTTLRTKDAWATLLKAVEDWDRALQELRERVGLVGAEESPGVAD
jgi:hypothetical protein